MPSCISSKCGLVSWRARVLGQPANDSLMKSSSDAEICTRFIDVVDSFSDWDVKPWLKDIGRYKSQLKRRGSCDRLAQSYGLACEIKLWVLLVVTGSTGPPLGNYRAPATPWSCSETSGWYKFGVGTRDSIRSIFDLKTRSLVVELDEMKLMLVLDNKKVDVFIR